MYELDVLIPTYCRPTSVLVTLTSLLEQTYQPFQITISDQTETENYLDVPEVASITRALNIRNSSLRFQKHQPRQGMAEQRDFLLKQATAPYVLFADDDILLENWLVERMLRVIKEEKCGFVGSAPIGLSYLNDIRPEEQEIEFWEGPVRPEPMSYDSIPWARHKLHNAANLYHVQQHLNPTDTLRYKVAWIGACVMYDRQKLLDVGGYSWWSELPPEHAGEDVLVQLLLLRKYGGCGLIPSGAYHLELPTQVKNRAHSTNELIERLMREQDLT